MTDITEKRFGMLVAIKPSGKTKHDQTMWLCKCDCGTFKSIRAYTLRNGRSKSCGCQARIGNNKRHGMTDTATYRSWCHMKERCDNSSCKSYDRYGGRGIKYAPSWAIFENFLADMGEKPAGRYSLDRIDNDGDYTPQNCRWANDLQQANNSSHVHSLTYLGFTLSVAEWARRAGINRLTLSSRLMSGWSIEKALTTKPRIR